MKTYIPNSKAWNRRPAYITTENAGAGSFLEPPFSKTHKFGIVAGYDRGNGYQEYSSIQYYLESDHVPVSAKAFIRRVIGKTETPDINTPEVQAWINSVMGYFKNCYEGESWNAADLVIDNTNSLPVDKHAGVHFIRKFYPDFIPTTDQLTNAKWGK